MGRGKQKRVWVYEGDRGNVVVNDEDPQVQATFIDRVWACRTVADVKRLDEEYPFSMEGALEDIEENGMGDQDPWDYTMMPGYGDGDWPPADDLGMSHLFTSEQFAVLVERFHGDLHDPMGGRGESFWIEGEFLESVCDQLRQWGFEVVRPEVK